jgi:hypothetical protein
MEESACTHGAWVDIRFGNGVWTRQKANSTSIQEKVRRYSAIYPATYTHKVVPPGG